MIESLNHGATVHIPLALGVLFPIFYIGCIFSRQANWFPFRIWYALWCLGLFQVASIWMALSSGEHAKVLSAADTNLIMRHEYLAFDFLKIWIGIALLLTMIVWVRQVIVVRVVHGLLFSLLVVQIFICINLGRLGGNLLIN